MPSGIRRWEINKLEKHFSGPGRAVMFYVKLFSLCIKGKTHFLGITPMVFGYSRSGGSQAGLAQRQLGSVEILVLTQQTVSASLMLLRTRPAEEIPRFLSVPCFPRPCWGLFWDSVYRSCWQEGRQSRCQPPAAFPAHCCQPRAFRFLQRSRFHFRVLPSTSWEGLGFPGSRLGCSSQEEPKFPPVRSSAADPRRLL